MDIIETKSPREDAGKALSGALKKRINNPILLMLSGGSAFSILDFVSPDVLGEHVTVMVLDERYSADPQVNNFAQLEQIDFYKICIQQGAQIISTKLLEDESMEALRDRFDTALHTWKEQNKDGVVIATMGIGSDGHTAGIFPGEHGVDFDGSSWVISYSVPKEMNEYTDRITVTNTFLRDQIEEAIIFVTGIEKLEIIKELQGSVFQNKILSKKPMSVLLEMNKASLYTDL